MFFSNAIFFVFPLAVKFDTLAEGLAECALKPVGPLELSTRGFVSPLGRGDAENPLSIGPFPNLAAIMITAGSEEKILPAAVVNDQLQKKLAEIEKNEGRKLGGRARKRLKEDIIHELLPRAFVKPGRCDALIDLNRGVIVIDTSSRKIAEAIVSDVRHALGSFPALPVNAEIAPRSVMTGWLAGDPLPEGLALGEECELRDPTDKGAIVRCQNIELQGDEIAKHLESGKQVARLALTLDDTLSFVVGDDLSIRKLRFLDGAIDKLGEESREDMRAESEARFALMAGEFRRLFGILETAFRVTMPDGIAW